jgi:sugar lactone lactonase YvrE
LTLPNGSFFSYAIDAGRLTVHGKVAEHEMPGERFEKAKNIGRAIAIDADGNAFTSGEGGRLFQFSASTGTLRKLGIALPGLPGREPFNRVDAWAAGGDGHVLYGGTSDGYLFRFDPRGVARSKPGQTAQPAPPSCAGACPKRETRHNFASDTS